MFIYVYEYILREIYLRIKIKKNQTKLGIKKQLTMNLTKKASYFKNLNEAY